METGRSETRGEARDGPTHQFLERAARAAGLALRWPKRVPNTRDALRVVEWVRRYQPDRFEPLHQRVFAAHFALGEDIGDLDLIYSLADHDGVDLAGVRAAMADDTAEADVVSSESAAQRRGVTGPPAWLIGDRVITGIDSSALQSICARPVTASHFSDVRR